MGAETERCAALGASIAALIVIGCAVVVIGCASGGTERRDGGGSGIDGGRADGAMPAADAGPAVDGAAQADGAATDARPGARDVGPPDAPMVGPTGLDSELAVPPEDSTPCTIPGGMGECPGIAVCRFYSPTESRCESCEACGNLFARCETGSDCDILFVCFRGQCTNFCQLGTYMCGKLEECIDIGHPEYGACLPY
jgi:hypothetical protein